MRGVLLGLAAGDRNGGPIRMALRLAESLRDCGGFDLDDIGARYLAWWKEEGFDTGPIAASVFGLVASGISFSKAVSIVHDETGGFTAGCNPAHRSVPLSMCVRLDNQQLCEAAMAEAALTHKHPLAGDIAAAVILLCRALIRGEEWATALNRAQLNRLEETRLAIGGGPGEILQRGGFAPHVLTAAVRFVSQSGSFREALESAVRFAGPANFCPVVVGAIGGARWGESQIDEGLLHHNRGLLPRIREVAASLAEPWYHSGMTDG